MIYTILRCVLVGILQICFSLIVCIIHKIATREKIQLKHLKLFVSFFSIKKINVMVSSEPLVKCLFMILTSLSLNKPLMTFILYIFQVIYSCLRHYIQLNNCSYYCYNIYIMGHGV